MRRYLFLSWLVFFLSLAVLQSAVGSGPSANYDESKVPAYTLPGPLTPANGQCVPNAETWRQKRRPEILKLFEQNVYGKSPPRTGPVKFEIRSVKTDALGGKATRKEVTVFLSGRRDGPTMDLLLYLPNAVEKPPVFLGLNFYGNQSINSDRGIAMSQHWMRPTMVMGIMKNRATEFSRGCRTSCWQADLVVSRGYGLVTAYYGDIEPDHPGGWKTGIRAALSAKGKDTEFKPDDWGAIGAWAWGLSRAMDYLEQEAAIDAKRVAIIGHSRLGKTALWAGAQDQRFALVISNDSGCGGAALNRRKFGETVALINKAFPYWFCGNFKQFNDHEERLPVDQHMLIALIAPRPVYIASAEEDLWADPRGEFLAALGADPVYRFLGTEGLPAAKMPPVEKPVMGTIGYHVRRGKHGVTEYDWRQYLDFADRHLKRKP